MNTKTARPLYSLAKPPRVPGTHPATDGDLTKQAFKAETDINTIIARYNKTGVLEHLNRVSGSYGDFDPVDFRESMTLIADAQSVFADLPSEIRHQFNQDPAAFFEYVADPANAEAIGLSPPAAPAADPSPPQTGEVLPS